MCVQPRLIFRSVSVFTVLLGCSGTRGSWGDGAGYDDDDGKVVYGHSSSRKENQVDFESMRDASLIG